MHSPEYFKDIANIPAPFAQVIQFAFDEGKRFSWARFHGIPTADTLKTLFTKDLKSEAITPKSAYWNPPSNLEDMLATKIISEETGDGGTDISAILYTLDLAERSFFLGKTQHQKTAFRLDVSQLP
ncbi:hypothetical protein GCM10007939_14540 [Amylibacter marinus]|uniref:Uncharacterized protein n=1 Tax=Amylibacter marinus TaxID=1475483 RepID=A0ABQ5VV90_9RHOB|nr:hypothetical protein [Amylibacter marinus]GLQ35171.1 hypothetical protein GCM10007939_14540 [Amylibacter marinus]